MNSEVFSAVVAALVLVSPVVSATPPARPPQVGIDTTFGDRFHEAQKAASHKEYAETVAKTTAALAMRPDEKNASYLYRWRSWAYIMLGDDRRALADLNDAIRCDPTVKAPYQNRAALNQELGNFAAVASDLTRVLRDGTPDTLACLNARASAYFKLGKLALARRDYANLTRIAAKTANDYRERGAAFRHLGQYRNASSDFATARRLSPADPAVLNAAAWFEATSPAAEFRDGNMAVRDATLACQRSKWKDADFIDTLAAACAETGNFRDALAYEKQAIDLETDLKERKGLQEHLALFEKGKPVREI